MAIDISPINSIRPAFLRLAPSILDSARPQLEPVGYSQRYGFIGPINSLERTNETSPTYLRAFVDSPNEPLSVRTLGQDELVASRVALPPEPRQTDLFSAGEDAAQSTGLRAHGLAQYSATQANDTRLTARSFLSIAV